ncbi:hypothetical protein [Methylobacterium sp. 1973]|uniref:hypothetical protein n=1 Tax=Methylobacterium sp. 1973 TaxID=3156421 RepID=UPI003395614B
MAGWMAHRWGVLRELLAVALFVVGLGATAVWIVFGTWFAVIGSVRALQFIIAWLR